MAAPRWRVPLWGWLAGALGCCATAAVIYLLVSRSIGTGSVTGTSLPSPDVDEAPTDPGTDALFYWELPAQLAGVAEPGLCEWNVGAEELVAAGPTERRSSATAAAGAPLGLAPDGRPFLWRGVWRLEGGWCGFAALVAGNYTRQPQVMQGRVLCRVCMK